MRYGPSLLGEIYPIEASNSWHWIRYIHKLDFCDAQLSEFFQQDKISRDDFLGGFMFDLSEVPKRKPPESPLAPQWYKLEAKSGKGRAQGTSLLFRSSLANLSIPGCFMKFVVGVQQMFS